MLVALVKTYLAPYRRAIWLLVLLQLIQTGATLYLPTLNADIIDHGVIAGDTDYILRTGLLMLAITLVQIVCAGGAVYFGARTAMVLGRDVRSAIFSKVQSLSTREVMAIGAPSLITRTTNDVQQVQQLTLMTFTLVVAAPITLVGSIALAFHQDHVLSLLLVCVAPVLVLFITQLVRRMRPLFRQMQERLDAVNRTLREQIAGIRVIRAFVRDDHELGRFAGANSDVRDTSIDVGKLMALMFPSVMLVVNIASVLVIWIGGHRIDGDDMQIGALTAFLAYLMQILMAVMMATFMFVMYPRAEVCAERIQEVLGTESSVPPPPDGITELPGVGDLELRGAAFRYPGADLPVLSGIDITARAGETTAIIGSTGSGKSTLVHLVPRLFDATEGAVLVDGIDVREIEPATLARAVSLVPQRPYLFSGTVASNLRYGRPEATDEELWHALEVAQAASFVRELEGGLDAPIAQGGTNVSGGQRQ
ncbi:MAG: ABC transporter ATP-binding protein, partial [Solirubrobacteraceae bacterium]|nr:ABC transporter ATP-binding protein [Solirubrobacteraceae bacterium]